jgi:DNA-binding response OmpR family regulator
MQMREATEVPPIVLLVENEGEDRTRQAKRLQMSGFWVATAADPDVAMNTATELRPHVIVAGLTLDGRSDGFRFIRAVSEHPETRNMPLVVLTARPVEGLPRGAHEHAAAVLMKPVAPDELARAINRVLEASRGPRPRSTPLTATARTSRERSTLLREPAASHEARQDDRGRNCPGCGGLLEWLERGTIGGVEYDYYRWCAKACGLYCYDRTAGELLKLA